MSLWNHYTAYTDLAYSLFNDVDRPGPEFPRAPDTPRELWPQWISRGWFEWEPDGWPFWSHHHHLTTWWALRDMPNVLCLHYGDLLADTRTEIQRLADFLDIDVPEERWESLLAEVTIDAMRRDARGADNEDPAAMIFEGGVSRFLYKGTNGRWRGVLTEEDLAMYDAAAAALDPSLRRWLEGGRHAAMPDLDRQ
jgi:aryl sulfotransferase